MGQTNATSEFSAREVGGPVGGECIVAGEREAPSVSTRRVVRVFHPRVEELGPTRINLRDTLNTRYMADRLGIRAMVARPASVAMATRRPTRDMSSHIKIGRRETALRRCQRAFLQIPGVRGHGPIFIDYRIHSQLSRVIHGLKNEQVDISKLVRGFTQRRLRACNSSVRQ